MPETCQAHPGVDKVCLNRMWDKSTMHSFYVQWHGATTEKAGDRKRSRIQNGENIKWSTVKGIQR